MTKLTRIMLLITLCISFPARNNALPKQAPTLFPEPLSPRIANYNIVVKLDVEKKRLDGKEVLIWHNKSQTQINELQFHLYLNAFRNSASTFMQESGGRHRSNKLDQKIGWGFIDVKSFRLHYGDVNNNSVQFVPPADVPELAQAGIDLTDKMQFIQPDDGNEHDQTVFSVRLPRPLKPGEAVTVQIDFLTKLPQPPFARTGAKEEYFFVGQWFPKIGVVTAKGWNTHQFHSTSEFFADYGIYNVMMTVPEDHVLGATGVLVEVKDNKDGTKTHFYHAEDVHDFAWTSSPEYVELTGKSQDVDIRVLMQPDHVGQGERHLAAAKLAVEYFQNWYGDYPFPNLTVVDPRRGARGSGGMEYPTLITAGTVYGLPDGIRLVEMVIIHEFGHNYWYHLLASNEFEEAWMDEGINTYSEIQIMHDAYGPAGDVVDFLGVKINIQTRHRLRNIMSGDRDPLIKKAWEYYSNGSYGANSYSKPGIVLTTLQHYLGKELMSEIMRTYFARWHFRHPTSQDFFDVVNEVAGQDLNWFIQQAFYERKQLDYAVSNIFSKKIKKPRGFDFDLSTETDSTTERSKMSNHAEVMADVDSSADSTAPEPQQIYDSGVNIRRIGEFKFPVEIEVVFANGDTVHENWNGESDWKKLRYTRPHKLVYATVDPDNKIPLDINLTNNSKTLQTQRLGINKISARWLFWMQFLLDQPDFFNLVYTAKDLF